MLREPGGKVEKCPVLAVDAGARPRWMNRVRLADSRLEFKQIEEIALWMSGW